MKQKCEYCEKEFEATTEKQLNANIIMHKINRHPDKITIKEESQ